MAKKLAKGQFDLDDLAEQLAQMKRMGGMEGLMGMLPGVQKIKKQIAEANINDKMVDRQGAIISLDDQAGAQEARHPGRLAQAPRSPPAPASRWPRSTAC